MSQLKQINMKKFNLDEYLKNPTRKVITGDGRNVRIICTDAKSKDYPLVALIKSEDEKEEYPLRYTVNGQYCPGDKNSKYDLFFVTEKHEGWGVISESRLYGSIFSSKKEAEEYIERAGTKCFSTIAKIEWEK